ncbi:DUF6491 family protein [Brevundimonas sp. SL130]|uniref:DUF6491 family protein n=1 Tax=Brevundimonas sp. SL130 TaxID=2995143 RepID=UPI00226D36FA|nr:DUF6491 family protein [Brevundimonas sp. SL130]WAC59181.1 DUF6491 family protein [Brevundimonas sp. SL130]
MRNLSLTLVASTAVSLWLSACAPGATTVAAAEGQTSTARCFRTDAIRNFRVDGQTDLYIRSLRDDVFLINTAGGCFDLDSASSIAVTPTIGGSDNICVGDSVRVIVPGSSFGSGACRAFVTKSLNADEITALPSRARP